MNGPQAAGQPAVQGRARTTGSGHSFVYAGPHQVQLEVAPPMLSTRRQTPPANVDFESVSVPMKQELSGINRITARRIPPATIEAPQQQPASWADRVQPSATIVLPVESGPGEEIEDAETTEFIAGLQAMTAPKAERVEFAAGLDALITPKSEAADWPAVHLTGEAQPVVHSEWHVREQPIPIPQKIETESQGWSVRESPLTTAEFNHLMSQKAAYQPFDLVAPKRARRMRWIPALLMTAVLGISVIVTVGFHPYQQNSGMPVEKASLDSAHDPKAVDSQGNNGQVNSQPGISLQQNGPDTTTTAAVAVKKVPVTGVNDPPVGYATIALSVLMLMGGMLFFYRAREKGVIEIVARGAAGYQIPTRR